MKLSYKHIQGGGVPGGHNVLWDGKREPFITPMAECHSIGLRHSDVVVDIGAYVGTYALICARFPVKKVIAYEPTPHTYKVLDLTRLPNLETHQAAVVGDDAQRVNLFISPGIGVTNGLYPKAKGVPVEVPAVRYEDAVRGATVVKIDVEGAEYLYDIVQPGVRAYIIDFHLIPRKDWVKASLGIIERLESAGYKPVITPNFNNGWTQAGSWLKETPDDDRSGYTPMLEGRECCGCGKAIRGRGRSLCSKCWSEWMPKHRIGYTQGDE